MQSVCSAMDWNFVIIRSSICKTYFVFGIYILMTSAKILFSIAMYAKYDSSAYRAPYSRLNANELRYLELLDDDVFFCFSLFRFELKLKICYCDQYLEIESKIYFNQQSIILNTLRQKLNCLQFFVLLRFSGKKSWKKNNYFLSQ